MLYIVLYLSAVNMITFFTFGADKRRAVKHMYRIPEKSLFLLALLGGSAGAITGMYCFRHKTKHTRFVIGMPLILLVQTVLIILNI